MRGLLGNIMGNNASSPLHSLCEKAFHTKGSEASFKAIQQWLNDNKDNHSLLEETAMYKDADDTTPLHLLVGSHPPCDLVEKFIQLAPDAVQVVNKFKDLPLHSACFQGASQGVVCILMKAYEGAVETVDKDGLLPLQYKDNKGMLYLHRACRDGAPYKLLQLFVDAYPDGCKTRDSLGKLPSDYLKEHWAAVCLDKDGMFPLHHACRDGASIECMLLFVNAYPEGCCKKDNQGKLPSDYLKENGVAALSDNGDAFPLHHASANGASVHLLKLLLDAYPDAIHKSDKDGDLPLHYIFFEETSPDAVRILLEAYQDGAQVQDRDGSLPLHCACGSKAAVSFDALKLLVDAFQQSITVKDHNGILPLDLALTNKAFTKEMRKLVSPEVVISEKGNGKVLGFLGNIMGSKVSSSSSSLYKLCNKAWLEDDREAALNVIQQWLTENKDNQELLQQAINYQNKDGITPLHWLVSVCPPCDLVETFIQIVPGTVKVKTKDGDLPIHFAGFHGASPGVMSMLMKADQDSSKVGDKDGVLPLQYTDDKGMLYLHRVCRDGAPFEILQLFVNAYPDGCKKKDIHGKIPSDYLKEHWATVYLDKDSMFPMDHSCRDGAAPMELMLLFASPPQQDDVATTTTAISLPDGEFVKLQSIVQQLRAENASLKAESSSFFEEERTARMNMRKALEEITSLQSELSVTRNLNSIANVSFSEAKSEEFVKLESIVQQLRAENSSIKAKSSSLLEEERAARMNMHNTLEEISSLQSELSVTRDQNSIANASFSEAKSELKALQQTKGITTEWLGTELEMLRSLTLENRSIKTQLSSFSEEDRAIRVDIYKTLEEITSLQSELSVTRDQNSIAKASVSESKNSLQALQQKKDVMTEWLGTERDLVISLNAEKISLRAQLSSVTDENISLKAQFSICLEEERAVRMDLHKASEEITSLQSDLSATRDQISLAKASILETRNEWQALQQKKDITREFLRTERDMLSSLNAEQLEEERVVRTNMHKASEEIVSFESDLSATRDQISLAKASVLETRNELQALQQKKDITTESLGTERDVLSSLNSENSSLRVQLNSLTEENRSLKAQFSSCLEEQRAVRMDMRMASEEISSLESKISATRDQVSLVKASFSEAKSELQALQQKKGITTECLGTERDILVSFAQVQIAMAAFIGTTTQTNQADLPLGGDDENKYDAIFTKGATSTVGFDEGCGGLTSTTLVGLTMNGRDGDDAKSLPALTGHDGGMMENYEQHDDFKSLPATTDMIPLWWQQGFEQCDNQKHHGEILPANVTYPTSYDTSSFVPPHDIPSASLNTKNSDAAVNDPATTITDQADLPLVGDEQNYDAISAIEATSTVCVGGSGDVTMGVLTMHGRVDDDDHDVKSLTAPTGHGGGMMENAPPQGIPSASSDTKNSDAAVDDPATTNTDQDDLRLGGEEQNYNAVSAMGATSIVGVGSGDDGISTTLGGLTMYGRGDDDHDAKSLRAPTGNVGGMMENGQHDDAKSLPSPTEMMIMCEQQQQQGFDQQDNKNPYGAIFPMRGMVPAEPSAEPILNMEQVKNSVSVASSSIASIADDSSFSLLTELWLA